MNSYFSNKTIQTRASLIQESTLGNQHQLFVANCISGVQLTGKKLQLLVSKLCSALLKVRIAAYLH